MNDRSANLALPFIMASQAQKHVTHNEALQRLDALVQMTLTSVDAQTPPFEPTAGEIHALGQFPTGDWADQDNMLAVWDGTAWNFLPPRTGWRAWDESNGRLLAWDGTNWVAAQQSDNLEQLGVNAAADTGNRLTVASNASLFTHDGTDHRLKINKAEQEDTASLLFQSGFTGHAEMGLTGDTDWTLKVSSDGSNWQDALVINGQSGLATGTAIQDGPTDTTDGRLMRTDFGYSRGNVLGPVTQSAGVPTGAVIERNNNVNGSYVRYADGTQICWHRMDLTYNTASLLTGSWYFPAAFTSAPATSVTGNAVAWAANITPALTKVTGPFRASVTANTVHYRLYRIFGMTNFGANDTAEIDVIAVGSWF